MTQPSQVRIPETEIVFEAVRAQGPGGQNVNKVASAIQLRFDVPASSLPESVKERILALRDRRVTKDGIVVIKAQRYRTQEKNREDALLRLRGLVAKAVERRKKRRPTAPSKASRKRRLEKKIRRGRIKQLRGNVFPDE